MSEWWQEPYRGGPMVPVPGLPRELHVGDPDGPDAVAYKRTVWRGCRWQGPASRFDDSYLGTPPWDIGRPQPAFVRLADDGALRGTVLDVGCGTGEHALMAAARGFDAVGVDDSPRAIERARAKAAERGLDVEFVVADALDLGALGRTFDTVLDCGLFHVFDDKERARYVESLADAVGAGGRFDMLAFSDLAPGAFGPRHLREDEIRSSFADAWRIVSLERTALEIVIRPGTIPAWLAVVERT